MRRVGSLSAGAASLRVGQAPKVVCQDKPVTPPLSPVLQGKPPFGRLGYIPGLRRERARWARAPEAVCLPTFLAVFAGVWEPEVSQPLRRQSPSAAHSAAVVVYGSVVVGVKIAGQAGNDGLVEMHDRVGHDGLVNLLK